VDLLRNIAVHLTPRQLDAIEVADLGLSELEVSGVQILTLVDTENLAVRLLVLFPNQTEPEHRHPPLGEYRGKEETIRCEWGELYLYAAGAPTQEPRGSPPAHRRHTYTVWNDRLLYPGDQVTLRPDTPHWFQTGPHGAVIWGFSTKAVDVEDVFTDPEVRRRTVVVDSQLS
jgi:D-lyxose ketol-isomerase